MSAGEYIGTPTNPVTPLQKIELLDKPYITVLDGENAGVVLKVLAHAVDQLDESRVVPIGYVSTKSGHAKMLGEFSGKPTGEYMPCVAVKGFVGESKVYNKNVSTDMPLSGLRTVIAERRAARRVKARLKS